MPTYKEDYKGMYFKIQKRFFLCPFWMGATDFVDSDLEVATKNMEIIVFSETEFFYKGKFKI